METSWKTRIVALVTLVAVAWLGFDKHESSNSPQTRNASIGCNLRDPLSHCGTEAYFGYPIGDGLVITLIEELY
jgi:hypothetical protein